MARPKEAELRFRLFFELCSPCAVHVVTAAQRHAIDADGNAQWRKRQVCADGRMTFALRRREEVMYNPLRFLVIGANLAIVGSLLSPRREFI